ncbi:hypothetical protein FRACYDRAFT_236395 [Fragilariopsis cylindrus CCMP1102]|uniref:Uncharacterized protein n=1 Tax=Fragilariopsis cylindrus CCMP1102 TaxID=635003 RepID=A0A1E7FQ75_9STRA|nr:hypothetical protein FRACYDRAFT_236395 [Fragilariopsis cylindrus CCMP1102]|eukprot:OEU20320.1 hypothetical protein FRACYDRAFT_236395 [Fragilariopsis cylindrus CCMP1102]
MKFHYYAVLAIAALSCSNTRFGVVNAQIPTLAPSTINRTGESSVVVFGGDDNIAKGDFSNVNGGDDNKAKGDYAVIAGGSSNSVFSKFSTISGGDFNEIGSKSTECTISGGDGNFIANNAEDSVITGGLENSVCLIKDIKICTGCTISGGTGIICDAQEAVRTGGGATDLFSTGDRSVVTGGEDNEAGGKNAVIVGGKDNRAGGTLSIALGTQAQVFKESSMVINLNPDGQKSLGSEMAGQFIANAKSYTFQIGQNNDSLGIEITANNIQNLIDVLENAA